MRNERTTQRQNATTETKALRGLQELGVRGLHPATFAEILRRDTGNGRMHTKQESEGGLDMNGIFVWKKTNTMGEKFPLKVTMPSITEGVPERRGTLWFKSDYVLEKERDDLRKQARCNMEGWEDLLIQRISFVDEGKNTFVLNEPILNVCTEYMGERVFIYFERLTEAKEIQGDEVVDILNAVPFSTKPDNGDELDDIRTWAIHSIDGEVDYDDTRKDTTD